MIKTMLIAWALNSHGAGVVTELPVASLAECYRMVGRSPPPAGVHAACVPYGEGTGTSYADAVATMNANNCSAHEPLGAAGVLHYCRGVK